MSIFPPFAVVVKYKNENRRFGTWEVRLVIRLSYDKNIHSAEIDRQIAEVNCEYNQGRECEEMVSVVQKRQDKARPRSDVSRRAWIEKFKWKKSRAFPILPRRCAEWVSLLSSLKRYLSGQSLKSNRKTKGVVQNCLKVLIATFYRWKQSKASLMTWLVTIWKSSFM